MSYSCWNLLVPSHWTGNKVQILFWSLRPCIKWTHLSTHASFSPPGPLPLSSRKYWVLRHFWEFVFSVPSAYNFFIPALHPWPLNVTSWKNVASFIYSFNKQLLSTPWLPLGPSLCYLDYRGEYDEIFIHIELAIQRDRNNHIVHERTWSKGLAKVRPKVDLWWWEMANPIQVRRGHQSSCAYRTNSAHIPPGFLGLLSVSLSGLK